jgi:hypothetical protein
MDVYVNKTLLITIIHSGAILGKVYLPFLLMLVMKNLLFYNCLKRHQLIIGCGFRKYPSPAIE